MRGCLAVVLLVALGVTHAQDADTPKKIVISAGTLVEALDKLTLQSGVQIMYDPDAARGVEVAPVIGTYTVRDALARLLSKTALRIESVNEKTVVLKRTNPSSGTPDPADQMRLAAFGEAEKDERKSPSRQADPKADMTVEDRRIQPHTGFNADIPRTIDDAQPYYVFDRKAIEASGATNIEDFLKQRLTMNAVAQRSAETIKSTGNTSAINLRGLGLERTLVLINGRPMAGASIPDSANAQPDLNGIPISAIERIEVLPTSASGIYGGSAMGGVVNVILKRDFTGGEMRVGYDNTWDQSSPGRNVSASYGASFEGGRTQLTLSGAWSDTKPFLLRDRAELFQDSLARIQARSPTFIYDTAYPVLGNLPNIIAGAFNPTLTLDQGDVPLNSRITHVKAGTSGATSLAQLSADLLANAGQWNLDWPLTTQAPTGLLRPFGVSPQTRSMQMSVRRRMLPWLDVLADFTWRENRSQSIMHPISSLSVPGSASTNPFTTDVTVQVPDATEVPFDTRAQSRSATLSALMQFSAGWTGMADYTWSDNHHEYINHGQDIIGLFLHLATGQLNPFVDSLLHPLDLRRYMTSTPFQSANEMHVLSLRASGPLWALPWGRPAITLGLDHRIGHTPGKTERLEYPIQVASSYTRTHYARDSSGSSAYLEATVPLVKSGWLPGLHDLDLQLAARGDRFNVDTGTPHYDVFYNRTPVSIRYGAPNAGGTEPIFSDATYESNNYTVGLRYQPVRDVTLRVSRATAFLLPPPSMLISAPARTASFSERVFDPVTMSWLFGGYQIVVGGNPELRPQHSRSLNAGLIWQPQWKPLSGLRVNAEYYRIEQFDEITSLQPQEIVNQEAVYPDRVQRGSAGNITLVDVSSLNLYNRDTEGWDLSIDYSVQTPMGRFDLSTVHSTILRLQTQYSAAQPAYDLVGFPSEGGAGKHKSSAMLNWESGPLMLGWTVRRFGSYRQYGAAGGSIWQQAGGVVTPTYIIPQGGDTIPAQTYHDLVVGYTFDQSAQFAAGGGGMLGGLSLRLGVRNVFDKAPALDAYYSSNYYLSPYGDARLRSYWLNATLNF